MNKNKKIQIEKRQKAKKVGEAVRRVTKGERAWKSQNLEMVWKDWSVDAVKRADAKNIPAIKILREREVKMVELDLDIPDDVAKQMYEYGRSHILLDRTHVINWVFSIALKNSVEKLGVIAKKALERKKKK